MSRKLLFLFIIFAALGIITAKFIFSFFNDTATSTSNTFAAAAEFPTPIPSTTPTPGPTSTPGVTPTPQVANHPVISEVQIHGSNANEDFIELYNPTNSVISLNGWQLKLKNSNGTIESVVLISSGSLPSHGFFLWASSKKNDYPATIGADISTEQTLSENYSLLLEDASDTPVDKVAWGNATDPYVEGSPYSNNPATDQSIERKAYSSSTASTMISGSDVTKGNGYDSDNNVNDFIIRTPSQPQNTTSSTETP